MARLKLNLSRRGESHEADDIVPSQPVKAHDTSCSSDLSNPSLKPSLSNLPLFPSQLSSPVDSSILTPSETVQEIKAVDVIRGSYIPDLDLVLIPNWSVQLQSRPDLTSSFELSDFHIHGLSSNSASEVTMTRPTTRSRARDGFSTASITQTVPQKRKRAALKSKKSPTSDSSVQNEDVEATGMNAVSTTLMTENEPANEVSPKLKITVEPQQPVTPSPNVESNEPQSGSTAITDNFQTPSTPPTVPSPVEGDSGISLASREKEAFLPKDNGVYETSTEPTEPFACKKTVDSQDEVLEENTLDKVDAPPVTVPDSQNETLTALAPAEPANNLGTEPDTLAYAANHVGPKDQLPDGIDTNESATAPQPTIAVQDNPAFIELPHNMGIVPVSTGAVSSTVPSGSLLKEIRSQPLCETNIAELTAHVKPAVDTVIADAAKKPAKTFDYGLTPGRTPFPNFNFPSAEACHQVNDLLSKAHGEVIAPKTIPEPSLTVTGCGEVPSVLDALIRTLLSGATSGSNSARAFNGLVQRFGTLTEGIGKGSVNWDAVRQAPLDDVFEAIKSGGLADIKSKNLKALLDQVYEENQERKNRHAAEDSSATDNENPKMSSDEAKEPEEVKEYDIASANDHFLNLQYIHKYKTSKALRALIRYPGIGPKTAACVLLFCLQRPCFAVDTHIFRISKWLGWVPDKANEITAFSHLDVKIPDELKYSLHQLFIKHGKECPRCRAITSPMSADWDKGCVIEELVKRTGRKKIGPSRPHSQAGPAKRTSTIKSTVSKKATKGKRTSRVTAKTTKKATVTPVTKESANKQSDALQAPATENVEQPEQTQPPAEDAQQEAQQNPLKRKRVDSEAAVPQRKQPSRANKNTPRAVASKTKSSKAKFAKNKKKSSSKKASIKKPAKKQKAATPAAAPTRTSPRLKLTMMKANGEGS
jgi:endonuclease III